MRLWSLHPSLLDAKGLVALWREGLLAQAVLAGATRGYRHHPQLVRFRTHPMPLAAIAAYLHAVVDEAERRGYRFDRTKLPRREDVAPIEISEGQLAHEFAHLLRKLEQRDLERAARLHGTAPWPHPLMRVVPGPEAEWEVVR
jgi:hypothetical protein